jgi:hypothetical protein
MARRKGAEEPTAEPEAEAEAAVEVREELPWNLTVVPQKLPETCYCSHTVKANGFCPHG